jgi:hypothetical protein
VVEVPVDEEPGEEFSDQYTVAATGNIPVLTWLYMEQPTSCESSPKDASRTPIRAACSMEMNPLKSKPI